jgi:hypothetical protein
MRRFHTILCCALAPTLTAAQTLVIANGTVIDSTGARATRATVVIEGQRIVAVDTGRYRPHTGARVINAAAGSYTRIITGSSMKPRSVCRKRAPVAPSITR